MNYFESNLTSFVCKWILKLGLKSKGGVLKEPSVGEPGQSGEWILVLKTENAHLLCPPPAMCFKSCGQCGEFNWSQGFCHCDKTLTMNSLGKNLCRGYEE